MICLDTNFLTRALIPGTKEALAIEQWLGSRELLSIPAVAWYDFLCGSTEEEERLAFALLQGRILPFTPAEAQVAASVFCSLQKPRLGFEPKCAKTRPVGALRAGSVYSIHGLVAPHLLRRVFPMSAKIHRWALKICRGSLSICLWRNRAELWQDRPRVVSLLRYCSTIRASNLQ